MTKFMVDPPSGWRYGFPKELDKDEVDCIDFNFQEWLIKNGYPKEDIESAVKYCRWWIKPEKEKEIKNELGLGK